MHCRAHAAQLRRDENQIHATGARIVAVGTGDERYARAFIDDEDFPYLVLLDEDGAAARAASVKRGGSWALAGPRSIIQATRAYAQGHRQKAIGKRPTQLGATFVIAPGDEVLYEHLDRDVADGAPLDQILSSLARALD
ncbi:MAG TPA: peroxiredoxin-like family protein [Actinomycetota bacterium]